MPLFAERGMELSYSSVVDFDLLRWNLPETWIILGPSHKASILPVLYLRNLDPSRFCYGRQMLGVIRPKFFGILVLSI